MCRAAQFTCGSQSASVWLHALEHFCLSQAFAVMTGKMKCILPHRDLLWREGSERVMTDIYAMRRANGEWFALEHDGGLHVPVFHSTHDAFMARLRTVEMLLFTPIALDAEMLIEIVDGRSQVDFCMVNNPFASLSRGLRLPQSQLASLLSSADPPKRWKWLSRPWS